MKQTLAELAVCGAPPAFAQKLYVGRPNIGDRAALTARLNDILDRRWLTNDGVYVRELERQIQERLGVRHCVAVCNATLGLDIAARALGLRGEVIIPSFTFVATAHALQWQAIRPVFCDVDPATHRIDPAQVERHITPRTTGLVGVHLWGQACEVEALGEIARRHRLRVLYDAAHAFLCTHRGRWIGNFGEAEVFSFHATKFFNSFEGGAIVTNDDALAARLRLMRNFGFADSDRVVELGTNAKMSEIAAAMGVTSLESLPGVIEVNRRNYHAYRAALRDIPGLRLYAYDESEHQNYQYIVVDVDAARAGLTRDELVRVLIAENVVARRYFYPGCHRMEPYRTLDPGASAALPQTERLCEQLLTLPTGTAVSAAEIEGIGGLLALAVRHAAELRARWEREGG